MRLETRGPLCCTGGIERRPPIALCAASLRRSTTRLCRSSRFCATFSCRSTLLCHSRHALIRITKRTEIVVAQDEIRILVEHPLPFPFEDAVSTVLNVAEPKPVDAYTPEGVFLPLVAHEFLVHRSR